MLYQHRSFTVPVTSGPRALPENCHHGWLDRRGNCVFCGQPSRVATAEAFADIKAMRRKRHTTASATESSGD